MKILHYHEDGRSIAFVLGAVALPALQWIGIVRYPALIPMGCALAFVTCVINHNHQHHPTFLSPDLNRVWGVLITLGMGQPATAMIPMHVLNHHVHNNQEEDYVRSSVVQFRWNLVNLLLFPFVAVMGYVRAKTQEMKAWRRACPTLHRQLVLERLALIPLFAVMLVAKPLETLVYMALPWIVAQWGIIAINLVQHDGCDPHSEFNHSRNFTGRWLNWWLFNNGLHTAHHARPDIHWSRLPERHREIAARVSPQLQERSLAGALLKFYVWPGRRPVVEVDA